MVLHAEHAEHDAALLPLGQVRDLGRLQAPADAVAPEERAPAVDVAHEVLRVGVRVLEELDHGHVGDELVDAVIVGD